MKLCHRWETRQNVQGLRSRREEDFFMEFRGTFCVETVVDSTVFLFPTLENLKLVTGQRLLDCPKHDPALVDEISELIADGAAHEKEHVVLSRAVYGRSHGRRARQ